MSDSLDILVRTTVVEVLDWLIVGIEQKVEAQDRKIHALRYTSEMLPDVEEVRYRLHKENGVTVGIETIELFVRRLRAEYAKGTETETS